MLAVLLNTGDPEVKTQSLLAGITQVADTGRLSSTRSINVYWALRAGHQERCTSTVDLSPAFVELTGQRETELHQVFIHPR